jgi:hypothetical protein
VRAEAAKMSYAYLFKYIIIGDTGPAPLLLRREISFPSI